MPFIETLPVWLNPGTEPPMSKKTEGWNPIEKPPADWWNWFMTRTYKALEELQTDAITKEAAAQQINDALVSSKQYTDDKISALSPQLNKIEVLEQNFGNHAIDYVKHPAYAVASGTNAYSVTLNPVPNELIEGMGIVLKISNNATGNCTLNVNSLGAKSIVKTDGTPVNNLKAGAIYTLRYSGVNFILQGEGGNAKVTNSLLKTGINEEIVEFSDERNLYTTKTLSYANYRGCKYDKSTGALLKIIDFSSESTSGSHHLTYTADGLFHRDSNSFPGVRVYDENKTLLRTLDFGLANLKKVQYGRNLNEFVFTTGYAVILYDTNGTQIRMVYKENGSYMSPDVLTVYRDGSGKIQAFVLITGSSGSYHGYFDTKGLTTSLGNDYNSRAIPLNEIAMISNHLNQYISSL